MRLLCCLTLLIAFLGSAYTQTPDERSDEYFSLKNPIPTLKLEVDNVNLDMLKKDPRKYVRGLIRNEDTVYRDVGLHLKGAAGSFRQWDDRPALTINCDKFKKNQMYNGLDKFHLNNSVQDNSFLNELIISDIYRSVGVPCPRVSHVILELNGRKMGLYLLKEGFDLNFLKRNFKDPNGNLYDGGFLQDIDQKIELDRGTNCEWKDLKQLITACRENDHKKRLAEMDKNLDLEKFFAMWVIESVSVDWDGYCRQRNNYRIYLDPTSKKFVFFAHGKDQLFSNPQDPLIHQWGGLCARKLFETEEGKKRFISTYKTVFEKYFDVKKIHERIDAVSARILVTLEKFDKNKANEFKETTKQEKQRIKDRIEFVKKEIPNMK